MICTNKFDMCKSNNKSIYHHALFLLGMAINGFDLVIIKGKNIASAWAFDTQCNETAQAELRFNLGPRTTVFFSGRCCLMKLKVSKTNTYRDSEMEIEK